MSKKSAICSNWYQTLSGQSSLDKLDDLCAEALSEIFGYYAIEIGVLSGQHSLLQYSRITTSFSLIDKDNAKLSGKPSEEGVTPFEKNSEHPSSVISSIEQLPIATDNVDLVIASHTLESSQDPHQVLREIDRVLVPEGHCILIGFNPFSLSQLGKTIRSRLFDNKIRENNKDNVSDKGSYQTRSVARVRDWFSVLGFEVIDVQYMGMRPAIKNKKLFDALGWLEGLGEYAGPILGNMYVIHAKKQTVAMRPDKKVWRAPAVLSGGKVVLNNTAQKIRRQNFSNL